MEPDAFVENVIEPLEFRIGGNKVLVRQHAPARGGGAASSCVATFGPSSR
jgi:hypothetical protein